MPKELTESQQLWIYDNSVSHTIKAMAEKFEVPYNTVYNFCKKHALKYALTEGRNPQRERTKTTEIISPANLAKEKAAVVPDPPRKWERPPAQYSNFQREQYIDKILNDGQV